MPTQAPATRAFATDLATRRRRYCSKACQRCDWPEHKIQCESVEEALLSKSGEGPWNVGARRIEK